MRRRLDLATALVHDPKVLFLDEPTTGLDPVSRIAIWDEVRKLNDEGTTVFLTTQYLEEADQLADRVGIIDEGRMAAEGTPTTLKAQIGRPHLEVIDRRRRRRQARGDPRPLRRPDAVAGRRPDGRDSSMARADVAPIVRALDDAGLCVEALESRAADARRRVRREDRSSPRGRRRGAAEPAGAGSRDGRGRRAA